MVRCCINVLTSATHLRGKGSGYCVRGLLAVDAVSLRLLSDWLLCTCRSTLLLRSNSVVMVIDCQKKKNSDNVSLLSAHNWSMINN